MIILGYFVGLGGVLAAIAGFSKAEALIWVGAAMTVLGVVEAMGTKPPGRR